MNTTMHALLVGFTAITLSSGCAMEEDIQADILYPDATLLQPTGIFVSGKSVNHGEQDGFARIGTEVFAAGAEGTSSDGLELGGLMLRGSGLASVHVATGATLSGPDLVGATFRTVTPAGDPIQMRIDAVEVDTEAPPDIAVHRYTMMANLINEPGAFFACGVDQDGVPIKAIPLQHVWDYQQGVPTGGSRHDAPDAITFACDGFALAKCVDLGYAPWLAENGVSLAAYHQACTRMIRADYCGDGRSLGTDQVAVHVYDNVGIQESTPNLWHTESEWTEGGARCVHRVRTLLGPGPDCKFEIGSKACGNPAHWDKTLLVSQIP